MQTWSLFLLGCRSRGGVKPFVVVTSTDCSFFFLDFLFLLRREYGGCSWKFLRSTIGLIPSSLDFLIYSSRIYGGSCIVNNGKYQIATLMIVIASLFISSGSTDSMIICMFFKVFPLKGFPTSVWISSLNYASSRAFTNWISTSTSGISLLRGIHILSLVAPFLVSLIISRIFLKRI